jgi:hypothetical protein
MRTVRLAVPVLTVLTLTSLLILPEAARATQLPDLTVSAVANPPQTARVGASIYVRDTVKNTGPAKAGASVTRYYLSLDAKKGAGDVRLTGTRSVEALLPQKSSAGRRDHTIPSSASPGIYFLLACADDTRKVAERNEGNNCRASSLKVAVAAPYASAYTGSFSGSEHDFLAPEFWSWSGTATFVWIEQQAENGTAPFPDYYLLSSGSVDITVSGTYQDLDTGGTCTISGGPTTYQFGTGPQHISPSGLYVDNINDTYRVFGLEPTDSSNGHWWQFAETHTCPDKPASTYSQDFTLVLFPARGEKDDDYLPMSPDGSLAGSSTAFSDSQRSYQFQWDFDPQA